MLEIREEMVVLEFIRLRIFKKKWRKKNKNNFTVPNRWFPMDSVTVGKDTYGELNIIDSGGQYKLTIGSFCSIAPDVTFILQSDHIMTNISTYPFKVKLMGQNSEAISKGNINIGDDVWIGYGAIILSGISIGQGAVIAAGSVVTHSVPAYAIVAGNPAKTIRYRFDSEIIAKLKNINYSKLDKKRISNNISMFYKEISHCTEKEIDDIISNIFE